MTFRLRASSKKGPISTSFSTHLVEKFQRYRELGLPIRVHLRVDARSESGADFCLRNRSALAVNCCVIIHCLEVSCKEDQITSAQRQ